MINRRATRFAGTLILLSALALATVVAGPRAARAQSDDAQVRIVHASPDAPAVDIWVDGAVAVAGLEFGAATDLIALPAGSYDVAVTAAGDAIENAVIEATLDLEAGAAYEVAAVGFLAEISAAVFALDLDATADGEARVRVVHASPDAPAVDVVVAEGPALIEGLEFPDASDDLDVAEGAYDLQVLASGTDTVALDLPGVALDAGVVYSIYAIGSLEDGTLTVLALTADAATAAGGGDTDDTGSTLPHTGVGSTLASSSSLSWLLALSAALLIVAGGFVARSSDRTPVRASNR